MIYADGLHRTPTGEPARAKRAALSDFNGSAGRGSIPNRDPDDA